MNGRYAVLAGRIRQDLAELERVAARAERAMRSYREHDAEGELFLDAAALNLHNFYAGMERIFTHIASTIDQSVPAGSDWHRELLRQMTAAVPGLRPPVLTSALAGDVDELLRFRHVVRHVYAFDLDPERVARLASRLQPTSRAVQAALLAFATFLDELARDD